MQQNRMKSQDFKQFSVSVLEPDNYRSISTYSSKTTALSDEQHNKRQQEQQLIEEWKPFLKDWNKSKRNPRVYFLCELGIPPSIRRRLWPLMVGNKLCLTIDLYNIRVQQSKTLRVDPKETGSRLKTFNHIQQDISRTFKMDELQRFFSPGGPLSDSLVSLLQSFCINRPDIGYVQGMTYVAGILLMYFEEYQSFVIFSSLITHPTLMPIYLMDELSTAHLFDTFNLLLFQYLPNVAKILTSFNINCDSYLLEWVLTLYSKALNPDITCRIWDMVLLIGPNILWKCGIALLKLIQKDFKSPEQTIRALKDPMNIKEDELIKEINSIVIPYQISEKFNQLENMIWL